MLPNVQQHHHVGLAIVVGLHVLDLIIDQLVEFDDIVIQVLVVEYVPETRVLGAELEALNHEEESLHPILPPFVVGWFVLLLGEDLDLLVLVLDDGLVDLVQVVDDIMVVRSKNIK